MGRTCGEPDEIKKNTHPKNFTALFRAAGSVHPGDSSVFLPFSEALAVARSLGLTGEAAWRRWREQGARPSNMPPNPHKTYKDSGWLGWGHWLSAGNVTVSPEGPGARGAVGGARALETAVPPVDECEGQPQGPGVGVDPAAPLLPAGPTHTTVRLDNSAAAEVHATGSHAADSLASTLRGHGGSAAGPARSPYTGQGRVQHVQVQVHSHGHGHGHGHEGLAGLARARTQARLIKDPRWIAAVDTRGRTYYWHSITREVKWSCPVASDATVTWSMCG